MPKGPKDQKRPADVIGNAVRVMEIATGQREEEYDADEGKDKAAAEMGRKGGKARAEKMTPDPASEHVSTSYVERQNLTMRMQMRRFTRLTNARLVQLADLVAYSIRRRYEKGEEDFLSVLHGKFDRAGGVLYGLVHHKPPEEACACFACQRRAP